jgi:RNA polymerase sigma-70 factor, ECF subfamily
MSTLLVSLAIDEGQPRAKLEPRHLPNQQRRDRAASVSRVTCETGRKGGRTARTAEPLPESPSEGRASARDGSAPSDEELLAVAASDRSALAELYDRHAKVVYRLALAILGGREEAEDVTQEVFVAILEPTTYDPERGTVSAFLATMTRSRALDQLRRHGRLARLVRAWHETALPTRAPTPFEQVCRRRIVDRVRTVLAQLPGAQRQLLEMAYYRGLSQAEIASKLDAPLGTVKSRLRRALMGLEPVLAHLMT